MRRLVTMTLTALFFACGGSDGDPQDSRDAIPDDGPDTIALPGDALYPEGIAIAPDGSILVGSLKDGSILRVAPGGSQAETFVAAGDNDLVSTVGLAIDEERGLLWACSNPARLVSIDLAGGSVLGGTDLPGGSGFCNDVALAAGGEIYVSDSIEPRVLRLPAGGDQLEPWASDPLFAGDGFNLNGIALADGALYAVKYNTGELFRIPIEEDGRAGAPEVVTLSRPLESPDGLREDAGDLLVVEGGGRLARILLSDGEVTTLAEELDGPTSVAVSGRDAWVVEGQVIHLFDPTTGDPHLPFQLVRIGL